MMHGLHPTKRPREMPVKTRVRGNLHFSRDGNLCFIYASQSTLHRSLATLNTLLSVLAKMIVFVLLEAFCDSHACVRARVDIIILV